MPSMACQRQGFITETITSCKPRDVRGHGQSRRVTGLCAGVDSDFGHHPTWKWRAWEPNLPTSRSFGQNAVRLSPRWSSFRGMEEHAERPTDAGPPATRTGADRWEQRALIGRERLLGKDGKARGRHLLCGHSLCRRFLCRHGVLSKQPIAADADCILDAATCERRYDCVSPLSSSPERAQRNPGQ